MVSLESDYLESIKINYLESILAPEFRYPLKDPTQGNNSKNSVFYP